MSWEDCLEEGLVRKASPDKELAKSLVKMSENRINFIKSVSTDVTNAPILLAECYEALREICEATIALKGFKVYSHQCITYFLKDILSESNIAEIFDKFRKIRNSINYYGRTITVDESKNGIEEILEIIDKLKKHITDVKL